MLQAQRLFLWLLRALAAHEGADAQDAPQRLLVAATHGMVRRCRPERHNLFVAWCTRGQARLSAAA
jgi:hypothetical protein